MCSSFHLIFVNLLTELLFKGKSEREKPIGLIIAQSIKQQLNSVNHKRRSAIRFQEKTCMLIAYDSITPLM